MRRPIDFFDWDNEDDPDGNVQHIASHDVTPEEVEQVLDDPESEDGESSSSGRPTRRGRTATGRTLFVVFDVLDDDPLIVRPITAYSLHN